MASTKHELLRAAAETVESSEKVLAIAYQNQKKFATKGASSGPVAGAEQQAQETATDAIVKQSKAVWWDLLIKDLSETIQKKSREIV